MKKAYYNRQKMKSLSQYVLSKSIEFKDLLTKHTAFNDDGTVNNPDIIHFICADTFLRCLVDEIDSDAAASSSVEIDDNLYATRALISAVPIAAQRLAKAIALEGLIKINLEQEDEQTKKIFLESVSDVGKYVKNSEQIPDEVASQYLEDATEVAVSALKDKVHYRTLQWMLHRAHEELESARGRNG